jgi:hypothetical protein
MRSSRLRLLQLSVSLALVLAFVTVGTALAWPDLVENIPHNLHGGGTAGFYLWHNDQGLFLATTGPDPRTSHLFSGLIETDGRFTDVHLLRAERPDAYAVRENDQRIRFSLTTFADLDGLTFDVVGGTEVTFTLLIDGQRASPRSIFMGQRAIHPQVNPIILYR